jgi:hypothetical protein
LITFGSFVVLSLVDKRTDYDWCGSIAQAMKRQSERAATGQYRCVFIQRLNVTKSRKRGSRRILYTTGPIAVWRRPVVIALQKAA